MGGSLQRSSDRKIRQCVCRMHHVTFKNPFWLSTFRKPDFTIVKQFEILTKIFGPSFSPMSAVFAQQFIFRNYDPEQLRAVINGADLEHTIISPRDCSAVVQQFRCKNISIDNGHYSFPVFVRGRFAEGQICVGLSRGQVKPTWVNGHLLSRNSI